MAVKRIGNIAVNYDDSYLQPSAAQTEIYNMLGQNAGTNTGDQNFFQKKWNSIENAFGTTGAAIASGIQDSLHSAKTNQMTKQAVASRDDLAKKYGFNNIDDLYTALNNAEANGDTNTYNKLLQAEKEDQALTQSNVDAMKQNMADYQDWVENNYASKKINQDRGKFAGSAINTLSTATDIAGLTNGPISNAIQGGIEGIADELEQNGLENFSWDRARDNAVTGAVTGAAIGAVNKGMSNALAKNGGNLFKGSNKVTQFLNNAGSSTPLGRAASTVATGAGRGAISGAVGGATGAATQSALSGADIGTGFSNTIQGAVRGAQQGATTGATMTGTNMVLNKTPGVGNVMKKLNQASNDWENSGENFKERWANTRAEDTWGNRLIDKGIKTANVAKQGLQNVGESLGTLAEQGIDRLRNVTEQPNNRLAYAGAEGQEIPIETTMSENANYSIVKGGAPDGSDLVKIDNTVFDGVPNNSKAKSIALQKYLKENFQGTRLPLNYGEDGEALISNRGIKKVSRTGAINERGKVAGNLDEVLEVSKVNPNELAQPNMKRGNFAKDGFEYRETYVDVDGDVYRVRSNIGLDGDNKTFYALNRYDDNNNKNTSGQLGKSSTGTLGGVSDTIVPQTNQSVNRLNTLNPTGTVNTEYDPLFRATAPLGNDITTYDKTANIAPDQEVTIYRGVPSDVEGAINAGDYVTTNRQLAQDYAGNGRVIEQKVPASSLLDSVSEPLGEEYIYRPSNGTQSPETELYRTLTGQNNSEWDNIARESGFNNYDELAQSFKQANPDMEATTSNILDWADAQTKNMDTGIAPQKTSIEATLKNAQGEELLKQYGVVDQPMSRAVNGAETFQAISDMGFQKPADVERMATAITGANGAVSDFMRNVVRSADPVDTYSGVKDGQSIDDFIDESIELNALYGTPQGVAIKKTLEANLRALPSKSAGSVTFEDSAEDVFKAVQKMEKKAAELEGRGGTRYMRPTQENLAQAKVIKDVANLLKERIYAGADIKTALTPEASRQLKALAPDNEKWSSTVDEFFAKAKTPQDLRSFQKPWVNASRYIDNQYTQAATFGGRMTSGLSNAVPTTKAGLVKQAVDTVWNSNPALRARAKLYGKVADIATGNTTETPAKAPLDQDTSSLTTEQIPLTSSTPVASESASTQMGTASPTSVAAGSTTAQANTYNPSTQIYDLIGRNEGLTNAEQVRTANYLTDAVNQANATNLESLVAPSSTGSSTSVYNSVYGTPTTPTAQTSTGKSYFPTTGDYWTDILGSAMTSAIDADDAEAFGQLYAMYQEAISKQTSSKDYSNPVNWSTSDRSSLLKAQNGLDQIDQLAESYTNAVGEGSNAVQGTLRQWSNNISAGNLDPSAENYVKQANSIGAGIIKNLVNLGSTEYDAERYIDYLPKLTDTKEQAAQKLQVLRNAYQNVINNLYSVYNV